MLAVGLVFVATADFGPGLSTDGARYVAVADSLLAGRGLVDYLGVRLTQWPPLYPWLLAATAALTEVDPLVVGGFLNACALGLVVLLGAALVHAAVPRRPHWVLGAALMLAVSPHLLAISVNIASDPIFFVAVLLFLLVAGKALRTGELRWWLFMAVLAIAASMLRYAGLALVVCGAGLAMITSWPRLPRGLIGAALFGLFAATPIVVWGWLHNFPISGHLFGQHLPAYPLENLLLSFQKIAEWFVPRSVLAVIPAWALALFLLAAVLIMGRAVAWVPVGRALGQPASLPAVIFTLVYGGMLLFNTSTLEHRLPGNDRIHLVLLPVGLVLAAGLADALLPNSGWLGRVPRWLGWSVFLLWLVFPLHNVQKYVRSSYHEGDVSKYNIFNTRALRTSDLAEFLRQSPPAPDQPLYSNNEAAAWFLLRRQVAPSPRAEPSALANWLAQARPGWILWFEGDLDYKNFLLAPEELENVLDLQGVFASRSGDIYQFSIP